MKIKELEGADISLVEIKGTPHCKLHGAMNKVSKHGYWRCISTYRLEKRDESYEKARLIENNCRAGCIEVDEEREFFMEISRQSFRRFVDKEKRGEQA